mmetsp:Transcript_3826/g.13761  ORF Transcript_3826/g.13761 Transcript_3826/m.13761 type:complete len:104 (-) Transcript_3826:409-720(-)
MFAEIVDNIFNVCFPHGRDVQNIPPEQNLEQGKAQLGEAPMAQDVKEERDKMSQTQEEDDRDNFINDEDVLEEEENIEKKLLKIENVVNMKMKMRKRLEEVRR